MTLAYVALGTNLGHRLLNLAEARRRLALLGALHRGPVVQSPAWLPPADPTPQPDYLNAVDALETGLGAQALLGQLKRIERQMGRPGSTHWAPRVIDLDLILFGDQVLSLPELVVPHPRMQERTFVLGPLAVLAPGLRHPLLQRTVAQLLAEAVRAT